MHKHQVACGFFEPFPSFLSLLITCEASPTLVQSLQCTHVIFSQSKTEDLFKTSQFSALLVKCDENMTAGVTVLCVIGILHICKTTENYFHLSRHK